jgi:hypothetical protein
MSPLADRNPLVWRIPYPDHVRFANMAVAESPRFHHPARPDLVASRLEAELVYWPDPERPELAEMLVSVWFVPAEEPASQTEVVP